MRRISKRGYCFECDEMVDYIVKEEKKSFNVRGVEVTAVVLRAFCKVCGERITVESIEKLNDISIYDAYKSKMGLLTSREIIAIRNRRKLTQKEFAKLLCIGEKDIARYENGAIQSESINLLMKIAGADFNFDIFKKSQNESEENNLSDRIETIYQFNKGQYRSSEYGTKRKDVKNVKLFAC